ncbi:hypothetical protein [Mesobacillus subterraneus]|uniref:hypothetical protein n=1 Tax=Mesobacillus subterraneus TaxID=285983 RepID=UPI001FE2738A|nr:hypothetical protein [Mesobacillus subterraneus]
MSGCSDSINAPRTDNPTVKEMLSLNADADLFVAEGYVFSNASHVDWVNEYEYELGEQVGEITKQADTHWEFEDWTASSLPVGTRIYATNAPFYIAIVNGHEIPYIKLVEG